MFDKLRRRFLPAENIPEGELDIALAEAKLNVLTAGHSHSLDLAVTRLDRLWSRLWDRYKFLIEGVERNEAKELELCAITFRKPGSFGEFQVGKDLSQYGNDILLYLSIFAWAGGTSRFVGAVTQSQGRFVYEVVEHLIEERFAGGFFAKGMILKYGLTKRSVPNVPAAREAFELAVRSGATYADMELSRLDQYERVLAPVIAGREPAQWGTPVYSFDSSGNT